MVQKEFHQTNHVPTIILFPVCCHYNSLLEVGAPPRPVLECRRLVSRLGHEEEGAHGVQVEHGRLQLGQLDRRDPHRPDITEVVVAPLPLHRRNLKGK